MATAKQLLERLVSETMIDVVSHKATIDVELYDEIRDYLRTVSAPVERPRVTDPGATYEEGYLDDLATFLDGASLGAIADHVRTIRGTLFGLRGKLERLTTDYGELLKRWKEQARRADEFRSVGETLYPFLSGYKKWRALGEDAPADDARFDAAINLAALYLYCVRGYAPLAEAHGHPGFPELADLFARQVRQLGLNPELLAAYAETLIRKG